MEPLEYIRILRRRWYFLAIGLVVGLLAGFATAPGNDSGPTQYAGVHTLLVDPTSGSSINLDQAALLVTTGDVPDRVAERFGGELPGSLSATPDPDVSSLAVRGVADDPSTAAQLADAAAEELQTALVADQVAQRQDQLDTAQADVDSYQAQIDAVAAQLASLDDDDPARDALEAQQGALTTSYQQSLNQLQTLEQQPDPTPPLRTLERATGAPVTETGLQIPKSPVGRALLLGLFGLIVGAIGAIVSQRLDSRVRTKEDAEEAFGLPVLSEIPPFSGRRDRNELHAVSQPAAPAVEAYRALRTMLQVAAMGDDDATTKVAGSSKEAGAAHHRDQESKVVLVASPGASEGKTTTVANLAVLLAEVGKQVLVVSADFRRPRVHELFELPREPGLSDVLSTNAAANVRLSDLHLQSDVRGVSLLPSGRPVANPAPFLRETAQLVAAARKLFDYVLIDTAPLLVANDASELAGVADFVLLVARADRTHRIAARRAAELLERLDARVVGSVLVAANDMPTAYAYYRYRYYADSEQTGRRRRKDGGRSGRGTTLTTAASSPPGAADESAAPGTSDEEPPNAAELFRSQN
jgi:capsular exopolysaccharide synthesis family protein